MSTPELWKRAVVWTATGDGEFPYRATDGNVEYVLRVNDFPAEPLYTLMAAGVEIADLEDWPAPWTRPAMPENLRLIAARELVRQSVRDGRALVDLDRIAAWAAALCRTRETDPMKIVAVLDIPGRVVHRTSGSAVIEPPPLGSTRLAVGSYRGTFSDLDVTLAASAITRADLDLRFGPGRPVPMLHVGSPYRTAYQVTPGDTPYTITLFAAFSSPPEDATTVTGVCLRREGMAPSTNA